MSLNNLREFIALLEKNQQLVRISTPLSVELEITEVTDRFSKLPAEQNKALLFEHATGIPGQPVQEYGMPVLMNAFGSAQRMAWALEVDDLNQLNEHLGHLLDPRLPRGMGQVFNRGRDMLGALRGVGLQPKMVRSAPVQEVIETDAPTLDALPVLKCWPKDGGRFITLPQVITRNPQTGVRNVGMYRLQVVDETTLIVHWQRHKGGADHEQRARALELARIPAAIVLGGDPASMWCASAPLPPEIDEYLLAGYLRGTPVPFIQCITQPLEVPAEAEIVIEGYVDPDDYRDEGPFGDHTGYYTPVERFPAFHVTAITHRRDPIYPATVVGIPPMEDAWMGKATERLFLPLIRMVLPEIIDINMPAEGVFHNLVIASVQKRFPGHARKIIHGLWGLGLMALAKAIVVVDEWVDAQNLSQVAWQVLGNVDWSRDLLIDRVAWISLTTPHPQRYTAGNWHRRHRQATRRGVPARRWPESRA
jgi:4-hydroxy-3-polyprenylbenzoate decarboxylase